MKTCGVSFFSTGNSFYLTTIDVPLFFISGSDKYMKPITSNGLPLSPTMTGEVPVRRMVAVYDYDPQELSPNVDAEVSDTF